jgi:hypothetical protein
LTRPSIQFAIQVFDRLRLAPRNNNLALVFQRRETVLNRITPSERVQLKLDVIDPRLLRSGAENA